MNIENRDGKTFIGDVDVSAFSPSEQQEYLAAVNALQSEQKEIESLASAELARTSSAAFIIEKTRRAALQAEKVRKSLERATVDDLNFRELEKKHGVGRIAKLDTKGGLVVVRCPTEEEATNQGIRLANLPDASEREAAGKEYLLQLCEYPSIDEVRSIASKWPGLWGDLNAMQERLMSARAGDELPLDLG